MFGRLFTGCIPGKVWVGRMSAVTPRETVKQELERELRQDGWKTVKNKLAREAYVREEISILQQRIRIAIKEQCLTPALNRVNQGYEVHGLFWKQNQSKLMDVLAEEVLKRCHESKDCPEILEILDELKDCQEVFEALQILDESNDWLFTRQKIMHKLDESQTSIFRC